MISSSYVIPDTVEGWRNREIVVAGHEDTPLAASPPAVSGQLPVA